MSDKKSSIKNILICENCHMILLNYPEIENDNYIITC